MKEVNSEYPERALYVIGKKAPRGATEEWEITHYKIANSLTDAKNNIGEVIAKEDLMKLITPEMPLFAYNPVDGKAWKLEIGKR